MADPMSTQRRFAMPEWIRDQWQALARLREEHAAMDAELGMMQARLTRLLPPLDAPASVPTEGGQPPELRLYCWKCDSKHDPASGAPSRE